MDEVTATKNSIPELMTVAEVAKRYRVSKMTIYRMVNRHELPAVRVGQKNIRLRAGDVRAFFEGTENQEQERKRWDDPILKQRHGKWLMVAIPTTPTNSTYCKIVFYNDDFEGGRRVYYVGQCYTYKVWTVAAHMEDFVARFDDEIEERKKSMRGQINV